MLSLLRKSELIIIAGAVILISGCNRTCRNTSIVWAAQVSDATFADSWGTWKTNYGQLGSYLTRDQFKKLMNKQGPQDITIEEFLRLHVENERVNRYPDAKTAEEMYPPNDRPRGDEDIAAVNYFLEACEPVSPIVVARVQDGQSTRYIKLDGAHRLAAAALKRSKIRVVFVDL